MEVPNLLILLSNHEVILDVGDISVVIAASSPHRDAAFEACRKAIELIKIDVPIWKREITTSGESWVGWGGG